MHFYRQLRPALLIATLTLTITAPVAAQWPQQVAGFHISIDNTADPHTAVDDDGNVFLAGTFSGDATLGGSEIHSSVASSWDVYLAKYGPLGDLLWVLTAGGPGRETVAALALDPSGAAYLTGTFDDVTNFGAAGDLSAPRTPNPFGTADVFFAKAADSPVPGDPPSWQWRKAFRTRWAQGDGESWSGEDRATGLAVDDESVYAAVTATGAYDIYPISPLFPIPIPKLASHPDGSAALVRLASIDGVIDDIQIVGDPDGEVGNGAFGFGICSRTAASAVVCPDLPDKTSSGALALGSANLYLGIQKPGPKLDSYTTGNLSFRWRTSKPIGEIRDLALDANGDIYAVEGFSSVGRYTDNTTSAAQRWSHKIEETADLQTRTLAFTDAGSRLFVAGDAKPGGTSNRGVVWEVENLDADPAADDTDVPTSSEFNTIDPDGPSLTAGSTTACMATYTVTQADVDAGRIDSTSTVSGEAPGGDPDDPDDDVTHTDSSSIPLGLARINILKTSSANSHTVDSTITYQYKVENFGSTGLTNVTVTDPHIGLSSITCPDSTLPVDSAMVCIATYTVTQADIDAGRIDNTGRVSSEAPGGDVGDPSDDVTHTDSWTLTAGQGPAVTVTIMVDPAGTFAVGEVVDYRYFIVNTGTTTLTNVRVDDPRVGLSAITCDDNGTAASRVLSLASDGDRQLAVAGTFEGRVYFGALSNPQTESLTSTGGSHDAFVTRLDTAGNWARFENHSVGAEIEPPTSADTSAVPAIEVNGVAQPAVYTCADGADSIPVGGQAFFCLDGDTLYAIRPGTAKLTWDDGTGGTLLQFVVADWPDEADRQLHPHGATVDLASGTWTFEELAYSDDDTSTVTDGIFQRLVLGFTTLRFTDPDDGDAVVFTIVESRSPFDFPASDCPDIALGECAAMIGRELAIPNTHDDMSTGFVAETNAPIDATGADAAYDRTTRSGQIIPVNTGAFSVFWYEQDNGGIAWPAPERERFRSYWFACPTLFSCPPLLHEIIIKNQLGSEGDSQPFFDPAVFPDLRLYVQNDPALAGWNPNDEHALLAPSNTGSGALAAFALRQQTDTSASEPYVLVKHGNSSDGWAFQVYQVKASGSGDFAFDVLAGNPVPAPYPLALVGGCADPDFDFGDGANGCNERACNLTGEPFFEDYKGNVYAKADGQMLVNYLYPIVGNFYDDPLGQGMHSATAGDCKRFVDEAVRYDVTWPPGIPPLQVGRTHVSTVPDLPDLQTQAAVEIVFEGGESEFVSGGAPSAPIAPTALVKLYDPVSPRWVDLPSPLPIELDPRQLIEAAPWSLEVRLEHDAVSLPNRLAWKGLFREESGEPLLLPNVMTAAERDTLKALGATDWQTAIDALYALSRDPRGVGTVTDALAIGLDDPDGDGIAERARLLGQPGALSAGAATTTGYVTLAFNNDPSLEPSGLPVTLAVIKVGCEAHGAATGRPYQGVVHVLDTDDVFSERLTLRHSGDFGGDPADVQFDWYLQLDTDGEPDDLPSDMVNAWIKDTIASGEGSHELTIEGANVRTLSDNWVYVHYGPSSGLGMCSTTPPFAGSPGGEPNDPHPQIAEGWIKRVVKGLNPFRARSADFHAASANTVVSMIRQAGAPYSGPIALNGDAANVNRIGLIEAYETVLRRGIQLSIDAGFDNAATNTALLLVAGRVADLYMLLANEGWADAQDPTIGFGTQSGTYGSLAPSIFAFQNQLPSLLGEELALLRGRDDSGTAVNVDPVFNRLFWNIETGDLGEVAYSQVYNLQDTDGNGFINTADARTQFPQGHGDAWGQYLSALESYTRLLRHPRYTWVPRAENVLIGGLPVLVDYRDERKLAATAAARAKAGSEIVDLTYRTAYTENPGGQWQGYPDAIPSRAWGVAEWGHRTGQGAYLDWVTANAVLPAEWQQGAEQCVLDGADTDAPFANDCIAGGLTFLEIGQIDRSNVPELAEIACHYDEIQSQLDEADAGLNPLGLARGVVPFDIDPSLVDSGETHFEQIQGRAIQALDSAVAVFDHANQLSEMLRRNQDSLQDFSHNIDDRERDLRNRLIETFGYPYADDIGGAGTYPASYDDADLYHYNYVDPTELTGEPPGPTETITAFFAGIPNIGRYIGDPENEPPPNFEVEYAFDPHGIGLVRPASWTGSRKAPGELQRTLSEYYRSINAYDRALVAYDNLLADIDSALAVLAAQFDLNATELDLLSPAGDKKLNEKILDARISQLFFRRMEQSVKDLGDAFAEALPITTGASSDVTSATRSVILVLHATIASSVFGVGADVAEGLELSYELAKEEAGAQDELELETARNEFEVVQRVAALTQLIRQEPVLRLEAFDRREIVRQTIGNYQTSLARGLRLLDELSSFRARTAGEVQEYRYQDMAFRVARNDALQKYKAQFDLAARYTYLAATAYDYETNLLGTASDGGRDFLTDIVKHHSLGEILSGQPQVGARGLSDPLARMGFNFQVLKGQLGFNNPQTETTRFALRSELQRISDPSVEICHADGSFDAWGTQMTAWRVDNLWDLSEFRRFARPFAAEPSAICAPQNGQLAGCEPALVIPFDTTVTAGLNFFGFALGSDDSAYDASNFATRVRSIGTWLTGYENAGLSATPSVYVLPVGNDVLRPPSADDFTIREWAVVDQVLPVPFPIGASDLLDPAYIPVNDGLSGALGQLGDVRRISSFRAYPDSGTFDPSQMTTNSRLIGRSVWNTQWLLIIPGRTLLADPFLGLDKLVCNVSDIKLFFQTYAYSGN